VSQADLWLDGRLKTVQPIARDVPWPGGQWVFAPLGYRPAAGPEQRTAIVPTYSPGLPLLMAGAALVAGPCAVYWIVPLSGGVLVLATFGVGRRLGSPGAGLLAAALVLASPVFLFMLVQPMTDVPVAAAWALALYLLIDPAAGRSRVRTLARVATAGLVVALAILIRPNLIGGVLALSLWFPLRAWHDGPGSRARQAAGLLVFGAAASTGAVAVALVNQHLYGSPMTSGYGGADRLFSAVHIWPNVTTYFGWFAGSHTVLPLLGLAALAVPLTRFWPAVKDRAGLVVVAAFAAVVLASYLVYEVFDAWWYLRFLLPIWPIVMLGFAAVSLAIARSGRLGALAVAAVLIWLGARHVRFAREHGAFDLWKSERRYASVGRLVDASTEPDSVIFAMQHSGSLRHYAGRMTARFDAFDREWLDRVVTWMAERGTRAYLVLDDWEEGRFRARFEGQQTIARLGAPLVVYHGTGTVRLYDLTRPRDAASPVTAFSETWGGPRCPPRASRSPGFPEPLRRVADNEPDDAAGQHDLDPVVAAVRVGHRRDQKGEHRRDAEADEQALRQRLHARGVPADEGADDDALHGGAHHDGHDLRGRLRRRDQGCQAVHRTEHRSEHHTEHWFVHQRLHGTITRTPPAPFIAATGPG
jgi:hypothetical protein